MIRYLIPFLLIFLLACGDDDSGSSGPDKCDPAAETPCKTGFVCTAVENSTDHFCHHPFTLAGKVVNMKDQTPIAGATVIATNTKGSFISDPVVTDQGGNYLLQLEIIRNDKGEPVFTSPESYTLRVAATDFIDYPSIIRPALPITPDQATLEEENYHYTSSTTTVALIELPADQKGLKSISGKVAPAQSGVLIAAECDTPPCPFSYTNSDGSFSILNVPAGDYTLKGYYKDLNFSTETVTMAAVDITDITLTKDDAAETGTLNGSINIVNAPGGAKTSVVLIPKSVFHAGWVKGEIAPGLRAPDPETAPNIDGDYTITGIPAGEYVVLAAFENDQLVRDPDTSISGTDLVYFTIPDQGSYTITLESFKVTESINIVSPGEDDSKEVAVDQVKVIFKDDSSEDGYEIRLFNSYGEVIWNKEIPKGGGEDITVDYDGDPLDIGFFYQFQIKSFKNTKDGKVYISTSEDLKGLFSIKAAETAE